ncbi:MAG: hypothetical protein EBU70_10000, partial [Actinobacteria bacterium]|nr:hypothetical protein [Actinomycetota bacterium]
MTRVASTLIALALAALGVIGLAAGPAQARTSIDSVASALRSNPVYNDPAAENALTSGQAADLRAQIASTGLPIYIAVLPASAAAETGGPDALLRDLRNAVGRSGVYAVIAGNAFRAGATEGSVTGIADSAFQSQASNGPYAVLEAFVAGVDEQYNGSASGDSASTGSSGSPFVPLVIIGVLAAGVVAVVVWARRRSRAAQAQRIAALRGVLDQDVTQLGERLGSFDLTDSRLDDAGRADLQRALDAYASASSVSARATTDADVTRATTELEEGRYALACVEARMDGRALPSHRPPCFVDPRHGPSSEDVDWAPDGGVARPVPVCASCAVSLQSGSLPDALEVDTPTGRQPYWRAGASYAPYARGYYSSWGDILPALFIGTMLAVMRVFHEGFADPKYRPALLLKEM